jgi:hypothetical protein
LLVVSMAGGCSCTDSDGNTTFFYPGELTAKDVTVLRWRQPVFEFDPAGAGTGVLVKHNRTDMPVASTEHCDILENPIYDSEEGVSPIQLTTSKQSVTATYLGDRYEITGLVADAAFAQGPDELVVSHAESGAAVTVPAPTPLGDPNDLLRSRLGLATELHLPGNSFDRVVVFVNGMSGADTYEVACGYPYERFMPVGNDVVLELVESEARDAIEDMGITPVSLIVSIDNEKMTEDFFPGFTPTPVRAGRAFSISAADLTPAAPGDCSFPTVVSIDSFTNTGKLCFEQSPTIANCMVTSTDCEGFATHFEFQLPTMDDRRLRGGPGLQVSSTTAGTLNQPSNGVDALPEGTEVMVEAADFNQVRYMVGFTFQGPQVTVHSLTRQ